MVYADAETEHNVSLTFKHWLHAAEALDACAVIKIVVTGYQVASDVRAIVSITANLKNLATGTAEICIAVELAPNHRRQILKHAPGSNNWIENVLVVGIWLTGREVEVNLVAIRANEDLPPLCRASRSHLRDDRAAYLLRNRCRLVANDVLTHNLAERQIALSGHHDHVATQLGNSTLFINRLSYAIGANQSKV